MQISISIPAYNEEKTIGKVIKDFKKQLPKSKVYVCDNNSSDKTAEIAKKAGACVLKEKRQGKGYALRKLFTIKSDVFVMVDGDDTYPAEKVKELIQLILENKADMVIGSRQKFNSGMVRDLGNFFITKLFNLFFRQKLHDALSGYRAFKCDLIKKLKLKSKGFEIESEFTVKTIENNFGIIEIPIFYQSRNDSKLRVYKDGIIIIFTLIKLFRAYHPVRFIFTIGFILSFIFAGLIIGQWFL